MACYMCFMPFKVANRFHLSIFFFKFLSSTVFVSSLSKVSVFYCVFVSIKYNRFFCLSTSSGPQYYFQLFVHCPCFCTKKYCWIYITFYDCQFQLIGYPSISQYSFHFVTYIFRHFNSLFNFLFTFVICNCTPKVGNLVTNSSISSIIVMFAIASPFHW